MFLQYTIKKSKRAKNISLSVNRDATIVLTLPWWVPKKMGKVFVDSKRQWILKQIKDIELKTKDKKLRTREDYIKNKEKARVLITERLKYFNQYYNLKYNRISIRDTKTRWGSCSSNANLNFSYKLLFLPNDVSDYIIVHELCHLKEMNHSRDFWNLVAEAIPNHRKLRSDIRKKGMDFY